MRVEEFHEDSESESSVDEEMVNPNNRTQMGLLNSPPPDEARNVVDAVQLLVKQMAILTSKWADMKKELETIKAWQENVQIEEPEFDLPDSIYDDTNDENSDEGYVSDPDEKSDSEMSDSFPVHPSTHFEPSVKRWKVDERVEFSYTLRGIRKWVPGRIAHVRSVDAYDVWLDTGEMERCVFAHELRSVQPGSIEHNYHQNDPFALSFVGNYGLAPSNDLNEARKRILQKRLDRTAAADPRISLINRVQSLPSNHRLRYDQKPLVSDDLIFDEPHSDVPTQEPTSNQSVENETNPDSVSELLKEAHALWHKYLSQADHSTVLWPRVPQVPLTNEAELAQQQALHAWLVAKWPVFQPPKIVAFPDSNNSSQGYAEVSPPLPLSDSFDFPRDYLNFGTDANSDPILAYRNYTLTFPVTLFDLVSSEDASIVGWQHHGTSFAIRDMDRFVNLMLPKYFQHNDITSFQRQLRLYGFRRSASYDKGAYFHPQFKQGQRELAKSILRVCEKTGGNVWNNNCNGSGAGISHVDTSAYAVTYLRTLPAGSADNVPGVTATPTSVYAPTITTDTDLAHNDQPTYPPISKITTAFENNLTTTEELFSHFCSGYPKNATTYRSVEIDWKVGDCVQCYEPETSIWQQSRVTNVNSYGTAASKIYSYDVQLDNGEQRRLVPTCFLRSSAADTLYYESSEESFAHRSVADSDGAEWNNTHSNSALKCADSSDDDNASIYTDSTTSYRKRSQQPPLPSPDHYSHPCLYAPFKENFNVGDKVYLKLRNSHTWALGTITYRYSGYQPCSYQYDVQLDNGDKLIEVWSWQLYSVPSTREYRDIPLHAFDPFAITATTTADVFTGAHSPTSAAAAPDVSMDENSDIYSQFLADDGFAPSFDSWPPEWTDEIWKVGDPVEILDCSTHTWQRGRIARLPVGASQFHVRLDTGKLELYVHPDRLRVLGTYVNNTVPEKSSFGAPVATGTSASTTTAVCGDKKHFYIIVVLLCIVVLLVFLNLCLLISVVYNALLARTIKVLI
eukprot:gene7934-9457_t